MQSAMIDLLMKALGETVYMVAVSMAVATAIGVPLGVLLSTTGKGGILEARVFNKTLGAIVNAIRSTPFIILLVAIQPLTRLIVGTSIGTAAALVPLTIAAAPMISRLVESSLREVDRGLYLAVLAVLTVPPKNLLRFNLILFVCFFVYFRI